MRRLALALAVLLAACATPPAPTDPTIARIETGQLKGVAANDVIAFKGVPYAAAPIGDLRWKPTQRAAKWSGVRDAAQHGAVCMQKMPNPDNGIGQYSASEDCLTLGVWTPGVDRRAKRPVMLWIHGGGFVNGSGSADLYDGTELAKRGVVVVTINYRLGRFGSFAHPMLTKEAAGAPIANYGMMDMIASLEWTRRNIASFGGDPNNVTIFGESAGGMAVQKLMTSPKARGLFHKAAVQSGAGRENVLYLNKPNARGFRSAEADGEAFINALPSRPITSASAADLRSIPAELILSAGDPSTFSGGGPIIDGQIITMPVVDAFKQGLEAKVPYLVGYNSAEFPSAPAAIDASLTRTIGAKLADLPQLSASYPDPDTMAAQIVGDIVFGEPARHLAGLHAANGQPTFFYRFDVVSASVRARLKGTTHAQERQYVFDTLRASPYATDDNDAKQAKFATAYWTNFAKTGDPNGAGLATWPRYASATDQLLEFTNDGPVGKPSPHKARWDAITARYPAP